MAKQEKTNKDNLHIAEHSEPAVLPQEVRKVMDSLNPEQRRIIVQAIKQESFSGPIPHPELLRKYDEVQLGFAERIVSMAEKQLEHRIKCESAVVNGSVSESKRGQNYGLVISLLFLIASVFLGYFGHDWLAGVIGGGTLIALVTVFVSGHKSKEESNNKSD